VPLRLRGDGTSHKHDEVALHLYGRGALLRGAAGVDAANGRDTETGLTPRLLDRGYDALRSRTRRSSSAPAVRTEPFDTAMGSSTGLTQAELERRTTNPAKTRLLTNLVCARSPCQLLEWRRDGN
jgi:hypothetical protein